MSADPEPWPLAGGDLTRCFAELEAGRAFRAAFETLLGELPRERADRLLQLHAERRGAWVSLLAEPGGRALLVGNALSGSVAPLAAAGFDLTLGDESGERLRLARASAARQVEGGVRCVRLDPCSALPFADRAFDLVVLDDDRRPGPREVELREAHRVCAGELVVLCDNRLAYKRSSGRWRDLRRRSPLDLARRAVFPRAGERTLAGWRRAVGASDFEPPRALALYPDRRDFAHLVDLDGGPPHLWVGPNEARNHLKVLGRRLGLFPLLTPSFALIARRRGRPAGGLRIERILRHLAERLGEPTPVPEHVFATRGNTSVILSALPGRGEGDPAGRYALHVPLYLPHAPGLDLHLGALRRVRDSFPDVPVPEALFSGALEGLWISAERRVGGVPAQHLVGDPELADRILLQAAEHLARLVVRAAEPLSEADFEMLVAARVESIARSAPDADTRAALERLGREARAALVGAPLPRVIQHGDLRAKHVQVDARGAVLGYVDWGTASMADLPGFDLLHLFVHDTKQRTREGDGAIWRRLLAGQGLRPAERAALDLYADRVGHGRDLARDLAALYPVVVGAIAEMNWPWTRPGWFRRAFEI